MYHVTWHQLPLAVIKVVIAVAILLCATQVTANAAPVSQTSPPNAEIQVTAALSTTFIPQISQPFPAKLTSVVVGTRHVCGLSTEKNVHCWGDSNETAESSGNLAPISGLEPGVKAISTNLSTTCALLEDGAVACWGYKRPDPWVQSAFTLQPTRITGWAEAVNTIAVGDDYACALLSNGQVQCAYSGLEEQEILPRTIIPLADKAKALKVSSEYNCAQLENDELQCWMFQRFQPDLSNTSWIVQGIPEKVIDFDVNFTSCAVTESGTVWCWDYASTEGMVASQLNGLADKAIDVSVESVLTIPAIGYKICVALVTGQVQCWEDSKDRMNYVSQYDAQPTFIPRLNQATQVDIGPSAACALQRNGIAMCWGQAFFAVYGNSTTSPYPVYGLESNIRQVSIANAPFMAHTCTVDQSDTAKCWGYNSYGQLGNGTTSDMPALAPVDVNGLEGDVEQIALGTEHTCAILKDSSVNCWGNNYYGQLGDGTNTLSSIPKPVPGITDTVKQLALGSWNSCALLNNGGVQCWGRNIVETQDHITTTSILTPTFVAGLQSGVQSITSDSYGEGFCALMESGSVRCWGISYSASYQYDKLIVTAPVALIGFSGDIAKLDPNIAYMDDGTVQLYGAYSEPQTLTMNSPISNVAVSSIGGDQEFTSGCAILDNGTLQCWRKKAEYYEIAGLRNLAVTLAVGSGHQCAILKGNSVQCWGDDELIGNNIGRPYVAHIPIPLTWLPAIAD